MRAWLFLIAPLAAMLALCGVRMAASQPPAAAAPAASATNLPITQIVLHSNGLGHFKREGEVDGHARVELTAPASDMNDMLKSLAIDDNASTPSVIYDSRDGVEQSFAVPAIGIIANPVLGELLHQSRGESVEVVTQSGGGEISGSILGIEERSEPLPTNVDAKTDVLNLWADSGVRGIRLKDIRSVKFVNAKLDAEVRRALGQLAAHRDSSMKTLLVNLNGDGRRKVGISYVAEAPVWKATYRLTNSSDGGTRLQGLALIENTSNEDWHNVKLILAGSRPVSFQMDLYPPLFVPRPVIEPSMFAALRPPTYSGPMQSNMGMGGGMQGGAMGFGGGTQQTNLGFGGGGQGFTGSYRNSTSMNQSFGAIGGGGGSTKMPTDSNSNSADQALTFDKYKSRIRERKSKAESPDESIHAAMEIAEDPIGEPARYVVPGTVSIPKMKSALVPFFNQVVEANPVSVFSPAVHASRALQAFRVKNNTGHPLSAGPVTVARADGYAGDARFTEWPTDEERFVAFATDLGCVCQRVDHVVAPEILSLKLKKGEIELTQLRRLRTDYSFQHRGGPSRTVWIEHPIGSAWKLTNPEKPAERTRDGMRFRVDLTKGNTSKLEVAMELEEKQKTAIMAATTHQLSELAVLKATSPAIKQVIEDILAKRDRLAKLSETIAELDLTIKTADDEQGRLRRNLERVPNGDPVQKHLLEKLAKQEAIIDDGRKRALEAQTQAKTLRNELQVRSTTASVE